MIALMEYIRRLVLVVLMLRVTEMLAPEGEMKSYVRFISGVLLLLAILSPLVQLVPAIEGGVSSLFSDLSVAPPGTGQALAEKGREDRHEQTLALYGERLAGFMAGEIGALPALRTLDLHIEVQLQVRGESGEIEKVVVYLWAGEPEDDGDEAGPAVSTVRIPTVTIGDPRQPRGEEETAREVPPDLYDSIAEHLASRYRLRREQIRVLWGERDHR